MKRLLSWILALAMILSMIPAPMPVHADEGPSVLDSGTLDNSDISWTCSSDGTLSISGTGEMEDFSSSVPAPWKEYANQITSIVVCDGITSIGSMAFASLRNAVTVTLPASLTTIGQTAFRASGITAVTIPASVTTIGKLAFGNCPATMVVTFAGSAPSTDNSFSPCTMRTNIHDNSWTEEVKAAVCSNATWDTYYPDVTASGDLSSDVSWLLYADGVLYIRGAGAMPTESSVTLAPYKEMVTRLIVEEGVTSISTYAFECFASLTEVSFPSTLEMIEDYAFTETGIRILELTENLQTLCDSAFRACSDLTQVTIRSDLTEIGPNVFNGCSALTNIHFSGAAPATIQLDPFYGVTATVRYPLGEAGWTDETKAACGSSATLTWEGYCPGHTGVLENASDATCDADGYTGDEVCSICGEVLAEGTVIPATGMHTPVIEGVKDPTCSVPGYTGDEVCSDCGTVITTGQEIPTTAHTFSGGKCSVCGAYGGVLDNGITWYIQNKVLYVTGEGDIPNYSYYSSTPWYSRYSSITSIVIGEGITSIGTYAFGYQNYATGVTFPSTVTSIGTYAFYKCTKLTEVTLVDGLTTIGKNAFYDCTALTTVTFPSTVKEVGSKAFYNCSKLTTVHVTDLAGWAGINFEDYYATPCYYARGIYVDGEKLTELVIPEGVTSIGKYAFYYCNTLTSVTIPSSVTSIASYAFSVCNALTEVHISDLAAWCRIDFADNTSNPLNIAKNLYLNGELLTELVIPESITAIKPNTFYNCASLTDVIIHENVTSIGSHAFYCCSGLTELTIPGTVESIGNSAFSNCSGLSQLTLGEGIQTLNTQSFSYNKALTEVTLPNSVTVIPAALFYGCSNLAKVTLGNAVTTVGQNAFYNCAALAELVLRSPIASFGEKAFYGCSKLAKVDICDVAAWCATEFTDNYSNPMYLYSSGAALYLNGAPVTELMIPEGVTSIVPYAFYRCSSITSVTIPESLTAIGKYAFSSCNNLECVSISDLAAWCAIDFADSYSNPLYLATALYVGGEQVTELVIPEGTTAIKPYAFRACKAITAVTLPESLTAIGDYAFYSCPNLATVSISGTYAPGSIGSYVFGSCEKLTDLTLNEGLCEIGTSMFSACKLLPAVVIPEGVTAIGDSAFSQCYALTDIRIPDGVTTIGTYAFNACQTLPSVELPDSVTTIKSSAFRMCDALTEIEIPANVQELGGYAFDDCYDLETIRFLGDAPIIRDNVFSSVTATAYYPAGASGWFDSIRTSYGGSITWKSYTDAATTASGTCTDTITWTLTDDGVLLLSGTGAMPDYSYAYSGGMYRTTAPWASYVSGICKVIVASGITYIGSQTFRGCSNLSSITFQGNCPTFSDTAFTGLRTYVYYNPKNYTWDPDDLTSCGGYSVIWKPVAMSVKYLAYDFSRTDFTWSLDHDGVLTINVLTSGSWNSANPWKSYSNHVKKLIIYGNNTDIPSYAFQPMRKLESVRLESGVKTIGAYAFWDDEELAEVYFGEVLTSVGSRAFMDCTSLGSVYLPPTVTSVGDYAFCRCTSLYSVAFPGYNMKLGAGAFDSDSALSNIYITKTSIAGFSATSTSFTGVTAHVYYPVGCYLSNVTGSYGGTLTWTESTSGACGHNVWWYYFESSQKLQISGQGTISHSYAAGSNAPWGELRQNLKTIEIGYGIHTIPRYVFENCPNVTTVTLPASLTNLALNAFNNCSSLNNLLLPASLKSFYVGGTLYASVSMLSSMTDLYYEGTREHWAQLEGASSASFSGGSITRHYLELQPSTATCTTSGKQAYYAFNNNSVYSKKYDADLNVLTSLATVPALGHDMGDWVHTGDATCVAYAVETRYCSRCDHTETHEVIDGGYGEHAYESLVTDPTCTEQGYTTHTCTNCSDSYVDSYVDANGHNYEDFVCTVCKALAEEISGTCGENTVWSFDQKTGVLTVSGTGCMADYDDDNASPWHKIRAHITSVVIESGVTSVGSSAFSICDNLSTVEIPSTVVRINAEAFAYSSANCDALRVTFRCGAPAICTDAFLDVFVLEACYPAGNGSWNENALVEYGAFISTWTAQDFCGDTHSYGSGVVTNPTCTEAGCTTYTCDVCGHSYTEAIEAIGHKYESIVNEPNCTEQGFTTHTCSVCGDSYADNYVDALGHDYDTVVIAPNCTNGGYTTYTCHCGDSYVTDETAALGHDYADGFCSRCGESEVFIDIISQPVDFVGMVGDTATFTVTAEGEGLKYQWYFYDAAASEWKKSSGTNATLTVEFKAYRNNQQYRCEITDADGNTVTTNTVKLTAKVVDLVIVTQPVSAMGSVNQEMSYTVEATGNGLTYQWYYSENGGTSWAKSGTPGFDTNNLRPILRAYRDGYQFRCVVTDVLGNSITSDTVSMTVKSSDIVIMTQPTDVEDAILGELYYYTVEATGDNLTYRWQVSSDGGVTWNESWNQGYDTATLGVRMNANRDGNLYRCVITSGLKIVATTNAVILDMQDPSAAIVSSPSNQYVTANKTCAFKVQATGTDLTYQWYRSNDKGATWNVTYLSGYNTDTLSFVATAGRAAMYKCKITDGSGYAVWSGEAKLQILSAELKILTQPADMTCASGETATFTVEAQGDTVKYQWYASSDGGATWTPSYLGGYNTNSFSFVVNTSRASRLYKCVITDIAGNTVESDAVSVTIG